ncbi:MAG TPA: polysaccharide deacetylase family protein [Gaiellaceae bacterium]
MRTLRRGAVIGAAIVALASAIVGPRPPQSGAASLPAEPVPILMYHVIADAPPHAAFPELFVSPKDFAAEMAWLAASGYHAVTLQAVYDRWSEGAPLPVRPIVLSFDDGTLGDHTRALPLLRRMHWPGVLNLRLDALDSPFVLPAWRVRDLIAAGWEVDSHTITHPDLTRLDDAGLWHEVHDSRVALRREFHVPANFFCYPDGRFDGRVVRAVQDAGYLGATTTLEGLARPSQLFTLRRIRVSGTDGVRGLAAHLRAYR